MNERTNEPTRLGGASVPGAPEVGPPSSGWAAEAWREACWVPGGGMQAGLSSNRSPARNHREVADNLTGTRRRLRGTNARAIQAWR